MSRLGNRRAVNCGAALMAASVVLGGAAHGAMADGTEISFQPRIWYNFYSDSQFNHNVQSDQAAGVVYQTATTAYELPFYGGTVTLKNPAIGPGTLAVTILNGNAVNNGESVMYQSYGNATCTNSNNNVSGYACAIPYGTHDEVHRFDAEALIILPLKTNASLMAGGRYIGFDWSRTATDRLPDGNYTYSWKDNSDAYYAEIGVGLSAPISDNGRHILFANVTGLFGTESSTRQTATTVNKTDWSGGVDANVGYAYQVSDSVKFSARYRLFARSQLEHFGSEGSELMHGPELGLTYTIGADHQPLK